MTSCHILWTFGLVYLVRLRREGKGECPTSGGCLAASHDLDEEGAVTNKRGNWILLSLTPPCPHHIETTVSSHQT